jgi:hypothetical protein
MRKVDVGCARWMKIQKKRGLHQTEGLPIMIFPPNAHAADDARLLSALHALTRPPLIQSGLPTSTKPIHWSVYRPQVVTLLAATHHMVDSIEPDIIIAEWRGERGAVFHIGVRLHWKVDWHHHFRLFLPANGPALFMSDDGDPAMHFAIGADGELEALQGLPSLDRCELEAGLERARVALCDPMVGAASQPAFA